MAEAERQYMEANMPEYSVWIYVILLTLLEAAVRSQVSLRDSDTSYLQSNNEVQYIVENIQGPVHNERPPASTLRVKSSHDEEDFEEELVYNTNVKFIPPVLDFKERCLGVAHHEKVLLLNESANKTVHMSSISGETTHFHSSFFQDKVQGIAVSNVYRLRPLVGLKLPVNSSLDHPIKLYNPHPYPIQLVEVYSSSPDVHLELPTGQKDGPRQLWEFPPFHTKTVINIHFEAKTAQNHSAYVRLKLNHTSEVVVIPLEISVTDSAGLYLTEDGLDFGMSGSQTAPTTLPLFLYNSARKAVYIESIESDRQTKALKINFKPIKVAADTVNPTLVATITLNWQDALNEDLTSGILILRGRSAQEKLSVRWRAKPLEGGLWYYGADPLSFVVRNDYRVPVAVVGFELQGYPDGDTSKQLQSLQSENLNFEPGVVAPGESSSLFRLQHAFPPHSQFLIIHTNISTLNQTLPISDGRLTPVILSHRYEDELDLGLVSRGEKKYAYLALLNLNRESVDIRHWRYSHSAAEFQLLGIDSGQLSAPELLARTSYGDYNRNNLRVVKPGHYAVFRLYVEAPQQDGLVEGEVVISTEHEDIEIAFRFEVAPGALEVAPESLILDNCFPGRQCETAFHLKSTFARNMAVTAVVAVPPDPGLVFTPIDPQPNVAAFATSQVGFLGWDGNQGSSHNRYLGLQNISYTEWIKLLSLPQQTLSVDVQLVNKQWRQFQNLTKNGDHPWSNISLHVDTTKVRNLQVNARMRLSWPRLAQAVGGVVMFPLTQVGNMTIVDLEFVNPAADAVVLQLILEQDYPAGGALANNIPRRLLPSCSPCTSRNRRSFSMGNSGETEESTLNIRETNANSSTLVILLQPAQSAVATFKFHPNVPDPSSALLFIRNNLTMLEIVRFTGTGMAPQFRFGNRKPGSKTPLLFEYVGGQLADCERIASGDSSHGGLSGLTIKRSFTAKNSGDLPIFINNFLINGVPCEGFGFHVVDCHPFQLEPNASRKIDIAFTPDFTLSRIERVLTIDTSMGFAVNYSLVSTLPAYFLAGCSAALARPSWEPVLYYSVVSMMVFLLFCVLTVALFESDRVLNSALIAMSKDKNVQPTFDLKVIDSGVMASNGNGSENQNGYQKSNGSSNWDQCTQTSSRLTSTFATVEDTQPSNSVCKGKKKKGAEDIDRPRPRHKEKENTVQTRKGRWVTSTPSPVDVDTETTRIKNCPVHDNAWKQGGRRDKKHKKKGNKNLCVCASFEDETSSTTTESSNNDEDKEHLHSQNDKVASGERKLSKESLKKISVSFRNSYEGDDEYEPLKKISGGSKVKQPDSTRETPSPHDEKRPFFTKEKPQNPSPKSSSSSSSSTSKETNDETEKIDNKKLSGDKGLTLTSLELPYKLKPVKSSQIVGQIVSPVATGSSSTSNGTVTNGIPGVNSFSTPRKMQHKKPMSVDKTSSSNKCVNGDPSMSPSRQPSTSSSLGWAKVEKSPVSYSAIARFGSTAVDPKTYLPSHSRASNQSPESYDSAWFPSTAKKVPPPPGFSELDRNAVTDLGPIGTKRTSRVDNLNPLQLFIQQMRQHHWLQQFQTQQLFDFMPVNTTPQYPGPESSRAPGMASNLTVIPPSSSVPVTGTISPISTASDVSSVPSVNSLDAAVSLWDKPPTPAEQIEPVKDNWSDVNSLWEAAPKPPSEAIWGPGSLWSVPRSTWTPCPEEPRPAEPPRDPSEGQSFDPFRSLSSIWSPQNPEK